MMLLYLLSVPALLLGGFAVSAENIDFQPHPVPPFPANGSYTANLESSECAFAPNDCVNGWGYSSSLVSLLPTYLSAYFDILPCSIID
jgi:hypothetical protein